MATSIATGALKPKAAVILSAGTWLGEALQGTAGSGRVRADGDLGEQQDPPADREDHLAAPTHAAAAKAGAASIETLRVAPS